MWGFRPQLFGVRPAAHLAVRAPAGPLGALRHHFLDDLAAVSIDVFAASGTSGVVSGGVMGTSAASKSAAVTCKSCRHATRGAWPIQAATTWISCRFINSVSQLALRFWNTLSQGFTFARWMIRRSCARWLALESR